MAIKLTTTVTTKRVEMKIKKKLVTNKNIKEKITICTSRILFHIQTKYILIKKQPNVHIYSLHMDYVVCSVVKTTKKYLNK